MKILFISHEATLTGAPIVLLRFLKWIKQNRADVHCTVLCESGGVLEASFSKLYPVMVYNKIDSSSKKIPFRIKAILKKQQQKKIIDCINKQQFDLIYSNTFINGPLLEKVNAQNNNKVLVHVHEMQLTINEAGIENTIKNFTCAAALLANSNMVKHQLEHLLNKNDFKKNIHVVYPFVDEAIGYDTVATTKKDTYLIGGSGSFAWRKGVELFIYVAHAINKINNKVHFCWVGGDHDSIEFERYAYLVTKLALNEVFSFIPPTPHPIDKFKQFDVFFLSSVEEPFSLAAAECALLKIPLVCINDCAGIAELLIPAGGLSFSLGDNAAIANGINGLLNNDELRSEMGERARQIILENATVALNAPKIMKVLDNLMNK